METIDLKANLRDKVGKGSARFARKNNLIPAVIYGNKEKPLVKGAAINIAFLTMLKEVLIPI